jgi:hypothetical protein
MASARVSRSHISTELCGNLSHLTRLDQCSALLFVLYFARVRYLMSRAKLRSIWSYLPAWGALLLSGGALMGSARSDVTPRPRPPELIPDLFGRPLSRSDEVVLRLDGENIYFSQGGSAFEELRLGDTPEAVHLRKLLRDAGGTGQSVSVPIGSTIVASGGGGASGWGWKSKEKKPPSSDDGK